MAACEEEVETDGFVDWLAGLFDAAIDMPLDERRVLIIPGHQLGAGRRWIWQRLRFRTQIEPIFSLFAGIVVVVVGWVERDVDRFVSDNESKDPVSYLGG